MLHPIIPTTLTLTTLTTLTACRQPPLLPRRPLPIPTPIPLSLELRDPSTRHLYIRFESPVVFFEGSFSPARVPLTPLELAHAAAEEVVDNLQLTYPRSQRTMLGGESIITQTRRAIGIVL